MKYDRNAREKTIENKLRKDFFSSYNAEETLGDIDFAVAVPVEGPQLFEPEYFLWAEAQQVMDAGLALWRYYHGQEDANPDASFYDIRLHFQGVIVSKDGKEKMNNDSEDETYTFLISDLRQKMKALARHIEPKVYDYGFLKRNYDTL